jgi:hypothetical protein
MDDLCVHCGQPLVIVEHTPNEIAMATDRTLHRMGSRLCPDGSGHHACPSKAGYE